MPSARSVYLDLATSSSSNNLPAPPGLGAGSGPTVFVVDSIMGAVSVTGASATAYTELQLVDTGAATPVVWNVRVPTPITSQPVVFDYRFNAGSGPRLRGATPKFNITATNSTGERITVYLGYHYE